MKTNLSFLFFLITLFLSQPVHATIFQCEGSLGPRIGNGWKTPERAQYYFDLMEIEFGEAILDKMENNVGGPIPGNVLVTSLLTKLGFEYFVSQDFCLEDLRLDWKGKDLDLVAQDSFEQSTLQFSVAFPEDLEQNPVRFDFTLQLEYEKDFDLKVSIRSAEIYFEHFMVCTRSRSSHFDVR